MIIELVSTALRAPPPADCWPHRPSGQSRLAGVRAPTIGGGSQSVMTAAGGEARKPAVLALGRAGRNAGQRDSEWSFWVRWRLVSRAAVRGSGGFRRAAPREGSGHDDGHPVILAAHPCGMTVPERPGLHLPPHRVAALRGCRKMAVAGSSLLLSGWPAGGDSPERGGARRRGDDPILRWPRRCGADAAGRCMTGQRRAGPGSHRKRSAGAVSGPPGSGEPGPARSARSGAR